jgi:predicted dehydrogenase/threonine dehydrogenase-like Zn-dependent dehydrogenase
LRQLRQRLQDGALELGEVPLPAVGPHDVLVRTRFSFVSLGTERMKVSQARMNLAAKARERPDQVRQVLDTVREQGIRPTIRKVQERLQGPSTLGYSCSGIVEAVGPRVTDFVFGDPVAAIGEGVATHAEYNAVPQNLVARVPAGVELEDASASAIGAIAIHALRQAQLELGQTVAVVGLGLVGQFLVQLCLANGCRVLGVDLDPEKWDLALQGGAEAACEPDLEKALQHALALSRGQGVDAVLLTAATRDRGPIELSAELVRDRGRVVCLGMAAIELDYRKWFAKEIDFRFSRAMGAGIYDRDYFFRDADYPIGYVRWTANRNMQAFLSLLERRAVDVQRLVTHRFPFDESRSVFDRIASGELAHAVGITFEYDEPPPGAAPGPGQTLALADERRPRAGAVRLGQIGAGNYAKSMLMPHFSRLGDLSLRTICTRSGTNAQAIAQRHGFARATTAAEEVIGDPEIDAVLVATRHDTHAQYAAAALRAGKDVFVEKPLALEDEQLAAVVDALTQRTEDRPTLWVGYNRRFSPLTLQALSHMEGIPVRQVVCTVRAAGTAADTWFQDPVEGGGTLFGDVCHFIDLCIWLQGSVPVAVNAMTTPDPSHREESWAITLRFPNGGLGVVHYVCGSQRGWDRETVDVLGGGRSARISGFRRLVLNGPKRSTRRLLQPDLGQRAMLEAMLAQFKRAPGPSDHTESFVASTQALLAARRSIVQSRTVELEPLFPFALR